MFPTVLAEKVFSLAQDEACPTIAFVGDVAPDGTLVRGDIKLTMANATRLAYGNADTLLADETEQKKAKTTKHGAELMDFLRVCWLSICSRALLFIWRKYFQSGM
jgi:exoribonuclease R